MVLKKKSFVNEMPRPFENSFKKIFYTSFPPKNRQKSLIFLFVKTSRFFHKNHSFLYFP